MGDSAEPKSTSRDGVFFKKYPAHFSQVKPLCSAVKGKIVVTVFLKANTECCDRNCHLLQAQTSDVLLRPSLHTLTSYFATIKARRLPAFLQIRAARQCKKSPKVFYFSHILIHI